MEHFLSAKTLFVLKRYDITNAFICRHGRRQRGQGLFCCFSVIFSVALPLGRGLMVHSAIFQYFWLFFGVFRWPQQEIFLPTPLYAGPGSNVLRTLRF